MPKRRCDERYGSCTEEPRQQQHLYLVLDDWRYGYTIRKVELPLHSGEDAEQSLPRPFFRFVAKHELPHFFTSAFGTRIIAMHTMDSTDAVPVIDISTRSVIFGPQYNYPVKPIYFPIGNKLFALDSGTFEFCRCPRGDGLPLGQPHAESGGMFFDGDDEWSWVQIRMPFHRRHVTSYAVHSDGQTILISTKSDAAAATFTFDTVKREWKCLGDWALPFTGRGHYDGKLEALVGLSEDPKTLGCLYSCKLPGANSGSRQCPAPAWKLSKERVFSTNPAERHVGATLVYMGRRARFCLVECVCLEVKAEDNSGEASSDQVLLKGDNSGEGNSDQVLLKKSGGGPERSRYMYRLMTFVLKYDKMEDLRVKCCRVRYYNVPKKASPEFGENPAAFWL